MTTLLVSKLAARAEQLMHEMRVLVEELEAIDTPSSAQVLNETLAEMGQCIYDHMVRSLPDSAIGSVDDETEDAGFVKATISNWADGEDTVIHSRWFHYRLVIMLWVDRGLRVLRSWY